MATPRAMRLLRRASPRPQSIARLLARHRPFHRNALLALPEVAFKLADIGEGIAEVEVLQWFVREGDAVRQFQHVCEVQSDKATVEITSRYDGVVKKLHYAVGSKAKVGSTLIDIEVDDAKAATTAAPPVPREEASINGTQAAAGPVPVPPVAAASAEVPSQSPMEMPRQVQSAPVTSTLQAKVLTSPAVRRLAREHSINLLDVLPTGPDGRLLKEDLLLHIRKLSDAAASKSAVAAAVTLTPIATPTASLSSIPLTTHTPEPLEQDQIVPLSPTRRKMVQTMTAALQVPHFGYGDEVEMDALHDVKQALKPIAAAKNVKLSYMPFFIKAASLALRSFPMLNASMNPDGTSVKLHAAHNISFAVDTPEGLVVPNIKHVQSKTIIQIAGELKCIQERALQGHLTPSDFAGGTFALSNVGTIGGTFMSPVLLVPQVAIGAMGKIRTLPRFAADGSVRPVRLMSVSWSGDHRVLDGGTLARFSNKWKEYMETPAAMLAELR